MGGLAAKGGSVASTAASGGSAALVSATAASAASGTSPFLCRSPWGRAFRSCPGPARVVSPTCPVCPVQACLVAVYADPNLTGLSVETDQNQPRLDQSQWQNQISSIMVKSGTWDFYPELEFRGQPLRLSAGSFPVLEPHWTKRIGSFMCVR